MRCATPLPGSGDAGLLGGRRRADRLAQAERADRRDGGPLFGARARAVAARGDWHLWVNTYAIVNKPGGMLSGGRGDQLATIAGLPEEAYGFWVDRGATIIQTDEPKAAIAGWRPTAFACRICRRCAPERSKHRRRSRTGAIAFEP